MALDPDPPREVEAIADALDEIDRAVNGTAGPREEPLDKERLRLVAAVENLVLNALEHGDGPVEIAIVPASAETAASIVVRNRVRSGAGAPSPDERNPRRGHGLGVIERVAAGARGRFAFGVDGREAVAALALGPGASAGETG